MNPLRWRDVTGPGPSTASPGCGQRAFERYGADFGPSLDGYRGHVRRVIALTAKQVDLDEPSAILLGIASFFHDAGIWMDGTFDYLPPSINRAMDHLAAVEIDEPAAADLVRAIIDEHHRQRRAKHDNPLANQPNSADRAEATLGFIVDEFILDRSLNRVFYNLILHSLEKPPVRAPLQELLDRYRDRLHDEYVNTPGTAIVAQIEGLALQNLVDPKRFTREEFFNILRTFLQPSDG